MALMHDWLVASKTANSAGTAVAMQTRMGILADIEAWARRWYDSHKTMVLYKKRILLWKVEITVGDCVGVFRLFFGEDFDTKLVLPAAAEPAA